jgi:uncharacterized protein (TIRG00374 family)
VEIKPNQRESRAKYALYCLFTIAVSFGVFSYLFSIVSLEAVLEAVKNVSGFYLSIFFAFSVIMSVSRTWRYIVLLRAAGITAKPLAMYLITLVRNLFSDLLPARIGTLIYVYLTQSRLGIPFELAASSFALSFLFDMIILGVLAIVVTLFVSSALIPPAVVIVSSIILLTVSILILWQLPLMMHGCGRLIAKVSWISQKIRAKWSRNLEATGHELRRFRTHKITLRVMALTLLVRLGKYMSLYALLLALVVPQGYQVTDFPVPKVFLGLCGAELAASLPISGIAGFGAYEGAWALIFQLLGFSKNVSVLTGISHHLITQVYGYSLGGCAILLLLLPYFKRRGDLGGGTRRQPGRSFWPRFALLAGVAGIILMLLTTIEPSFASQTGHEPGTISQHALAANRMEPKQAFGPTVATPVDGWLAYERTDGIYLLEIGRRNGRRIIPSGTYPRFSPNGKSIAFLKGDAIGVYHIAEGRAVILAKASAPRAAAFHPNGREVLYIDGKSVLSVNLHDKLKRTVLAGEAYVEIDCANNGSLLAITVKEHFGYTVKIMDLDRNSTLKISRGCSASLSPDGGKVTVNGNKHKRLHFYDTAVAKPVGHIDAPDGLKFDNQFWSNSDDWIASASEGKSGHIFIHRVSTNQMWRASLDTDCDRPDLYVRP